ncbi:MAG: flagellar biosynthesis protein FlhA [Bacteriovoracaceae bacterium]|nr:flagellar biosynthesis protein FlhA [Bacteriovoracaceae bacterium]
MLEKLKVFTTNTDLTFAIAILLILGVMMVPVPAVMLDLFLAAVIVISIVIVLMSAYVKKPLEFSTFPTVLLLITIFRLGLNVASTRRILTYGGTDGTAAAGQLIRAFGEFLTGGNYVVGIIIFLIFVIINFMVVTKGAGRVAEVAARFTLDAMPGKQMAIDADLNAGLIDDTTAKSRRTEIAMEADFYGSMDGASKFVRGDAIAGIMITAINILGGIILGIAYYDMSAADAAQTFTMLTIGDGLVGQIPALVISFAAGIVTTRNASSEEELGSTMRQEIKVHPKALYMAAAVVFIISVIPGIPGYPFWVIGGITAFFAYRIEKGNEKEAQKATASEVVEDKKTTSENLEDLLNLEMVELEVGYGLVHLVDSDQNGDLLERITHLRKQFALDWGIIIPSVRIKDNLELPPGGYSIRIKGVEVAGGELMTDHFLAMDSGSVIEKIEGIETIEPVFGMPSVWVLEDQKDDAQYNGYLVVDLSTIVATHITEVLKSNLFELFGRQELVRVMEPFKETNPKLVGDLIPDILPLGIILKVMQNLLREGVPVRDLRTIFESLAEYGMSVKDPDMLTEFARQSLYRTITDGIKGPDGDIPLFTLDRAIEEEIAQNLIQTEQGQQLSLDPKITQSILASLNERIEEATDMGEKMIVLCSPVIRNHFKRLTEKFIPNLVVISHNELSPDVNIRSLGTVRL